MPIELSKISAHQFYDLPRERTVFFFSVGPLEDHGSHLPMGMDLEEASRLSFLFAEHLEKQMPGWVGVIMPSTALGIESNTTRLAIRVRAHVLRDYLVDSCRSLVQMDFFHFVCFSGHLGPKQLTAIEEAGKLIRHSSTFGRLKKWGGIIPGVKFLQPSFLSASSARVKIADVRRSPFWPDPEEHGGKRDTSVAVFLFNDLVDPKYKELPVVKKEGSFLNRLMLRLRGQTSGYWGAPSEAERERGAQEIQEWIQDLFPKFKAVWEGANPNTLFRSWYSILPPNRSFIKSWVLAAVITLLLLMWIYLTLQPYSTLEF